MFKIVLILFFMVSLLMSQASIDEYPRNEKNRELILPKGKLEIDAGPAFFTKRENGMQLYLNIRYALTENLEIERLGLKYRFYKTPQLQTTLMLENYGLGKDNTSDVLYHHSKLELEGKYFSKKYYSIVFQCGYYFAQGHESEGSNDGKSDELRLTLSTPIQLHYTNSVTFTGGLRFYSYENYGRGNAYFLKISMTQNIFYYLDFVMEMALSTFSKATDSVLFNESYGRQINFRLRWRFF